MRIKIATINCYKQSGLGQEKQEQIADFVKIHGIHVVHLQESQIDNDTFCEGYIYSNFNVYPNNAPTGYGTATMVRNHLIVNKHLTDTNGRIQLIEIADCAFLNLYPQAGTDNTARTNRERCFTEGIPDILTGGSCNKGASSGDFNCITRLCDATNLPQVKLSKSLKRLIRAKG